MTQKSKILTPFTEKIIHRMMIHSGGESTLGDIEECYHDLREYDGSWAANIWLLCQILIAIKVNTEVSIYWRALMFKNYLKTSFRNMKKHKSYTFINIVGLTIGMVAFCVIMQYVHIESNYDRFVKDSENIYRVRYDIYQHEEHIVQSCGGPSGLYNVLKEEISGVIERTRLYPEPCLVRRGDIKFNNQNVQWVDSTFFGVFELDFISGNPKTSLAELHSAVLTRSAANRFFGDIDPMGEMIYVNEGMPFMVTGVIDDIPVHSHLKAEIFLTIETFVEYGWMNPRAWGGRWLYTYVKMNRNTDIDVANEQLKVISSKYLTHLEDRKQTGSFSLQPLHDLHFNHNLELEFSGVINKNSLSTISVIAFIILIIAWINYNNLTTAKAMERATETSLRKIVGADKGQLVSQYFFEALMINLFAIILTVLLVQLLVPMGARFFDLNLGTLMDRGSFWIKTVSIFVVGTLAFGVYPTLIISSFQPVDIFSKKIKYSSRGKFQRKLLVVFQFAALIGLLIGIQTIRHQIKYMQTQKLGFDKEHVLVVRAPVSTNGNDSLRATYYRPFRKDLMRHHNIKSMTFSMRVPGQPIRWHAETIRRVGWDNNKGTTFAFVAGDSGYISTFDIKLLAGRNFTLDRPTDIEPLLLTEYAVKELNFESNEEALNKELWMGQIQYRVYGVIEDFHFQGMKNPLEPIILSHDTPYEFGFYSFKISTQNIVETVDLLQQKWAEYYPKDPFDYFFLDEFFDRQYRSDNQFSKIIAAFTSIAVIIAGLGLFGLSSYTIVQRTKEIGVRKVMGASIADVVRMLIQSFMKWVLIANLVAWPLAYFVMKRWLESYPYRTGIDLRIFLVAGLSAIVIAGITVGHQAIRTARGNPIDSLRYE